MKQDYIRKLTIPAPVQEREAMTALLLEKGIEVFGRKIDDEALQGQEFRSTSNGALQDQEFRSTGNGALQGQEFRNISTGAAAADGVLYVSAADREAAAEHLRGAGLGRWISADTGQVTEKSLVEQAEEAYYRKRRMIMIECLVVLAAVMVFYLVRTLL